MKKKDTYKYLYIAEGYVYGVLWGGGIGSYPAELVTADTYEELISRINDLYKSGALDSGMGFEKLVGYKLVITVRTTVKVEGKEYSRTDFYETLEKEDVPLFDSEQEESL